MAFSNGQDDLDLSSSKKQTASEFLPTYFRTDANRKFLSATIDQMISQGEVEKINAFIGRKQSKVYSTTDNYLEDVSPDREAYQLEPALIIKDALDNVTFLRDYNDYINQLKFFNAEVSDHSLTNSQEYYSWDPQISWDKLVNYREYYWIPEGPPTIPVYGQAAEIEKEYKVRTVDDLDNTAYIFTPNGLTRNPTLTLYRGQTYTFEIKSPGHPMWFKTTYTEGSDDIWNTDISFTDVKDGLGIEVVDSASEYIAHGIENGKITLYIPYTAPDLLFYISSADINTSGTINVADILESTSIDVEAEIIGMKTYKMADGVAFSNGMRVRFIGNVTPEKYATDNWYVEGVGTKIQLVRESDLQSIGPYTNNSTIEFDSDKFDSQGFEVNKNYIAEKDYIVINRASKDRNPWSRNNRWVHREVIEKSYTILGLAVEYDQTSRARRPIIEFNEGLELYNFGIQAKDNVHLIDTVTVDVFSTIEGIKTGYFVDQVQLVDGHRVLFTADPDPLVAGRIFKVVMTVQGISLVPELDADPVEGDTVLITDGVINSGRMYHYNGLNWVLSQQKLTSNQPPLFEVYDKNNQKFSEYNETTFAGTRLFSYSTSGSSIDPELGFNVSYRNVNNVGDIVFNFEFDTDQFQYFKTLTTVETVNVKSGYFKKNDGFLTSDHHNGWIIAENFSIQPVVKHVTIVDDVQTIPIDVYNRSGLLTDLKIKVYVNSKRTMNYTVAITDEIANIQFADGVVNVGDSIIIKTVSSAPKNENGFYEFPTNLQNNPKNESIIDATLGELVDHVSSMVDNCNTVTGEFPGVSNIRDIEDLAKFSTKIIQNSSSLAPVIYHLTNKDFNVIKAIKFANREYNKVKRNFINLCATFDYEGDTRNHVDAIMQELVKGNTKTSQFNLSDMVPFVSTFTFEQEIIDESITEYPLTFEFDLNTLSQKAVLVYLNDEHLLHGKDYIFVDVNFVQILRPLVTGDNLKVIQYDSTDGCFVPPTPTKLGLYPLFEPLIYLDDTYQTPSNVIQGHDGSITLAFNDYRDELILEFEKRIFNNIKAKYDPSLFDIHDFISGYQRNTGLSIDELNSVLSVEFLKWAGSINEDYTSHEFFNSESDDTNSFLYNYSTTRDVNSKPLKGFWRAVYKDLYDTDRPHIAPWEMLGFTIEPQWWSEVYGPAPYTSGNIILWQDLATGTVREPGKLVKTLSKYVRPTLMDFIPVNEQGQLLSPLETGFAQNFSYVFVKKDFVFGDQAPVESAWRRSSYYPFALLTTLMLLRPAKVFATGFDRSRQLRDITGQIIYTTATENVRFNTDDLIFPSTVLESNRTYTAGLVNYVVDYIVAQSNSKVSDYKTDLSFVNVQLAYKMGGFTSKEKFKLILDSRSPSNNGNVFVPMENYQLVLNSGTPVYKATYSGVVVEKQADGFYVSGYNSETPVFKYFPIIETASDTTITVGGITAPYVEWRSNKYYSKGTIVRYEGRYYAVTTAHTSSPTFDEKYFDYITGLPIVGGRTAIIRKYFNSEIQTIPYGNKLSSIQDVVDFLLGYGKYLESIGFVFNTYNDVLESVVNWETSVREFLFWSTQNWAAGSLITLSPAAEQLVYYKEYSVVDSLQDSFYDYDLRKSDGKTLDFNYITTTRENNTFTIKTRNTADGIYHVTLNLVQKEHVLVLDNQTIFNDLLYKTSHGYRQERIKALGYRTYGWSGDFNVPGFIYDKSFIYEWESWKDFDLGDTVKYKEFYYSAKSFTPGTEVFEPSSWNKLSAKPEPALLPNWDYRANQFADFYDLDTDSFDVEQQKFAQHLIGYQSREYLANIINDEVSQYKFYQGYIQEKGTQNSLSKLFDALNSANKDSLEFYEEWALRLGQYGASASFNEVEYILDNARMLINPQPVSLVETVSNNEDFLYEIARNSPAVYLVPEDYDHKPFPVKDYAVNIIPTAGYVKLEDVKTTVLTKSEILTKNINQFLEGDYVWVGFEGLTWNIYRYTKSVTKIKSSVVSGSSMILTTEHDINNDIVKGDIIGLGKFSVNVQGLYEVSAVTDRTITIANVNVSTDKIGTVTYPSVIVYKFDTARFTTVDDLTTELTAKDQLAWVDVGLDNTWEVWQFDKKFIPTSTVDPRLNSVKALSVSENNLVMAVADSSLNSVLVFIRPVANAGPDSTDDWEFDTTNQLGSEFGYNTNNSYGNSLSLSSTGQYLAIGVPDADVNTSAKNGYVSVYTRVGDQYTSPTKLLPVPEVANLHFGFKVKIDGSYLYVLASGTDTVSGKLYVYTLVSNTLVDSIALTVEVPTDLDVSDGVIIIGYDSETVQIFRFEDNTLQLSQTITIDDVDYTNLEGSYFGRTVAISKNTGDSSYLPKIAIGCERYSGIDYHQGLVLIGELVDGTNGQYIVSSSLVSPQIQNNQQFGNKIKFGTDRIVVYSLGGGITETTFDNKLTTFDDAITLTTFFEDQKYATVYVFDEYDSKFVYSDTLTPNQGEITHNGDIVVTDRIYVDVKASLLYGIIDEFYSPQKSWTKIESPNKSVDIDKIKSVFLYNKDTNQVITYLDFIDPIQGKVAGIAEEEISFKTFYDPAVYHAYTLSSVNLATTETRIFTDNTQGLVEGMNVSIISGSGRLTEDTVIESILNDSFIISAAPVQPLQSATIIAAFNTNPVVFDPYNSWLSENVGKLWWDLTTVKFIDNTRGEPVYNSNIGNALFPGSTVDIYEWVETELLPSEWDLLADTDEGITLNISGKSKYGDAVYSFKEIYDNVTNRSTTLYYFWVKNSIIVPSLETRTISAKEVSDYIADPKSKQYPYVQILTDHSFSLVNCKDLIVNQRSVINFRYWITDNFNSNIHYHYQLITEGDASSTINEYIENKWIDSLVGFDQYQRPVPDPLLSEKLKYGAMLKPRQSMFKDRTTALKQYIARVNSVLITTNVVGVKDISKLLEIDEKPGTSSGLYDIDIDTYSQLAYVNPDSFVNAILTPTIIDGKITQITIVNTGKEYRVAPIIKILDSNGEGAVLLSQIDTFGKVISVEVLKQGTGYSNTTEISVRGLTVLVNFDETNDGGWSLYTWNVNSQKWICSLTQRYDTSVAWDYADWYATGYDQYTNVDYVVDYFYQTVYLGLEAGDIVKVKNQGLGWELLERTTENDYITVGRQNGTIQFNQTAYETKNLYVLRNIINSIRRELLVDELAIEYNKLFFASLRYALVEQNNIDWAFKTSFVRSYHNLGELAQPTNYQTDNLANYELYVKEVKPYRTKVREFISAYDKFESTNSKMTDFDCPVVVNSTEQRLETLQTRIVAGKIETSLPAAMISPWNDFVNNIGNSVKDIIIADAGQGYLTAPIISIDGIQLPNSIKAEATAYIADGRITNVVLTNPGTGYVSVPTVTLTTRPIVESFDAFESDIYPYNTYLTSSLLNETRRGEYIYVADTTGWPASGIVIVRQHTENAHLLEFITYNSKTPTSLMIGSRSQIGGSPTALTFTYNTDYPITAEYYNANAIIKNTGKPARLIAQTALNNIRSNTIGIKFDRYTTESEYTLKTITDDELTGTGTKLKFNLKFPADTNTDTLTVSFKPVDSTLYEEILSSEYTIYNIKDTSVTYDREIAVLEFYEPPLNGVKIKIEYAINIDVFSAYDRIKYYYNPTSGMYGKEYGQLMQGIDYGGVEVTGFDFNTGSGWDAIPWGTEGWDYYDEDYTDYLVIYAGETSFTLPYIPAYNELIDVYVNNVRQPALTITGTGATDTYTLSYSFVVGDQIIFRKQTSDGSINRPANSYDTNISGGDLAYTSATGLRPSDIIIDGGNEFVTELTSHAPEELIPGQIFDTLDIKVYDQVSGGSSVIVSRHYVGDSVTTRFKLGQFPISNDGVFVKLNNAIQTNSINTTVYKIDYETEEVVFTNPPGMLVNVDITSFSKSGIKVRDIGYVKLTQALTEIVTSTVYPTTPPGYKISVTVDGTPEPVLMFETDNTYENSGHLGVRFNRRIPYDSVISYIIIESEYDTVSVFRNEDIDVVTSKLRFPPTSRNPVLKTANTLVNVGGTILKSASVVKFFVTSSITSYTLLEDYFPDFDPGNAEVHVKSITDPTNIVLLSNSNYNWSGREITVSVNSSIHLGDEIIIMIFENNDYEVSSTENPDTSNIISFNPEISSQYVHATVTTFAIHTLINVERKNLTVWNRSTLTEGTPEYRKYSGLRGGRLDLGTYYPKQEYVWITLNKVLLTPGIDYVLEENLRFISFKETININDFDIIEVIIFPTREEFKNTFGFEYFKDIYNRSHYKRINDKVSTRLLVPLKSTDLTITVEDEWGLQTVIGNIPGVVMIEGERIEYTRKTGNVLHNLRRGTLGTGIKDEYPVNTLVRDFSLLQSLPDVADTIESETLLSDGSSHVYSLSFIPAVNTATVAVGNTWTRDSIPSTYGQCDEIEVFVGGVRLRKVPLEIQVVESGAYSSTVTLEAEFAVDGINAQIYLTEAPIADISIVIQRRKGQIWEDQIDGSTIIANGLASSTTRQAEFIRLGDAVLLK